LDRRELADTLLFEGWQDTRLAHAGAPARELIDRASSGNAHHALPRNHLLLLLVSEGFARLHAQEVVYGTCLLPGRRVVFLIFPTEILFEVLTHVVRSDLEDGPLRLLLLLPATHHCLDRRAVSKLPALFVLVRCLQFLRNVKHRCRPLAFL